MPTKRSDKEAVTRIDDSSILIPATISKSLNGSVLQHAAIDGLNHNGSASFAASA